MNGRVCGPPSPPWKEISSSKAQPSSSVGVVEAADHDVGDVREAVGAQQVRGRGGREARRAGPRPRRGRVGEVARRRARRARPAPCSAERTSSQPMCGCSRSAGISCGMALVDLLERQPPRLLHQVDEAEVPRAEDDDLAAADVVLGALLRRLRPVASPTAWPTIASCSSPPAKPVTRRAGRASARPARRARSRCAA